VYSIFKQYGKAMYRPLAERKDTRRDDIISYNEAEEKIELDKHIIIAKNDSQAHCSHILGIVKKYWD